MARAGQAACSSLGVAGDQGRRRRGLVPARRRALRRRDDRRCRRVGPRAAATGARCSGRWTRSIPATGVLFGRPGWTGQQAVGVTWGGDQPSDFWSLRTLVAATLTAAASGLLELVARRRRLPRRAARRALPEGVAAAVGAVRLLHAADARARALRAGGVDVRRGDAGRLSRRSCCCTSGSCPYVRAAAATAARCGLPIVRPLALTDPATSAAGRSPTRTATARRCWSRRCSRPARASVAVDAAARRLDRRSGASAT